MELHKMRWKLEDCPFPVKIVERKPKIHPEIKNFNELPENQKDTIFKIDNFVKLLFPKAQLYLFGSRINGRWNETSDYDIIVECDCNPEKIDIIKKYDFGVKIDLFFTQKQEGSDNIKITF